MKTSYVMMVMCVCLDALTIVSSVAAHVNEGFKKKVARREFVSLCYVVVLVLFAGWVRITFRECWTCKGD